MIGGIRLREAGGFDNVIYRERPVAQRIEDTQARRITKAPEEFGLDGQAGFVSGQEHRIAFLSSHHQSVIYYTVERALSTRAQEA
jgi:hypothetical protein